jgi:hypothetical protein
MPAQQAYEWELEPGHRAVAERSRRAKNARISSRAAIVGWPASSIR